jgi:hypothetical protein
MQRSVPIERDIIVAVPSAYTKPQRGAFFEKFCADILRKQSYEIKGMEVRITGMEIDICAVHKPSGKELYVECKFFNSKKIDANIVDLCWSQAFRARVKSIALFSTAALGKDAQGAYDEYLSREECDYSFYGREEIINALEACGAVETTSQLNLSSNITHATLLVHPEIPFTWLFQEVRDGVPQNLIAYSGDMQVDCVRVREILDSEELFENLSIRNYIADLAKKNSQHEAQYEREVVSGIIVADDVMDYKPCRPEDFVGRDAIQKEIWDYLDSVREHKTSTRLISLTGSSGNGKSSLVAFLAERFKNVKWKNKFYLYPVDVRSSRGAKFVSEAVVKAFTSAIKDGFISIDSEFSIDNVNDITSGVAFKKCSEHLSQNEKVIIIFFDQFEEVFMKEELFSLFRAFERFAIDVSSDNSNLVVGFSWRSGITLGDENPAYSMWNRLRDFRIDKKLTQFDVKDSSGLISTFEKNLGLKLNKSLRGRLIQQAQGFPWLLKKLCIHLFKKIQSGVSQEQLLISQLQIKSLFDEDLERPDRETECLRYVAKNSPVDQYETTKEFGHNTVNSLLADRLLIKTGEKISVYWDVFRDYLKTNEAPIVPWSYMPASTINMALSVLGMLSDKDGKTFAETQLIAGYKKGTLTNIIMDLQSFSLIEKREDDKFFMACPPEKVSEVIRSHLKGHTIYAKSLLLANESQQDSISLQDFEKIVKEVYSNKGGDIPIGYSTRLKSWLKYSGLIGSSIQNIKVFRDKEYSPEFSNTKSKENMFMAATTPGNVVKIVREIQKSRILTLSEQNNLRARNSVVDLISLGICIKNADSALVFSKNVDVTQSAEQLIAVAVSKASSINILKSIMEDHSIAKEEWPEKFKYALGKAWKDSSSKRYINGLTKYLDFSKSLLEEIQQG